MVPPLFLKFNPQGLGRCSAAKRLAEGLGLNPRPTSGVPDRRKGLESGYPDFGLQQNAEIWPFHCQHGGNPFQTVLSEKLVTRGAFNAGAPQVAAVTMTPLSFSYHREEDQ